jgi:LCP family protein required for cell wall assembly
VLPGGGRGGRRSALAKAVYGACCVAAASILYVSHSVNSWLTEIQAIGGSDAITSGPSAGPMNILIMGLESRRDYDGNVLPRDLLAAMHAGSVNGVVNGNVGGEDTNTLILIHIFNGGTRAVGYSIPRDDWVTFPKTYDGQTQGKIDQAYGLAWAQNLAQTSRSQMSNDQRNLLANEAGQAAAIDTVESLTGEHVDHFAEVNLAGFFELAKAFGGIMVCVKSWNHGQNLRDANSGAVLRTGYQHLWAAQALAYVRERDNLPNGDIDRTRRQQAVIDYVMWKLRHQGILSDLGQLRTLLGVAKQYVITDQDWDLLQFSSEMRALSGRNMTFYTAPYVTTAGRMAGQDVNIINPAQIQRVIHASFSAPPPAPPPVHHHAVPHAHSTVDVYNGGAPAGFAGQTATGLVSAGFRRGHVANARHQSVTTVRYGRGAAASAERIAAVFHVVAVPGKSVKPGHVRVILGADATTIPSFVPLGAPVHVVANPGPAGTPLTVNGNTPYGVPCTY